MLGRTPEIALVLHAVRASRIVLIVLVLCFVVLATMHVPRLVNPLWSDVEFTGWVSPIAARMVEGQRIYRDFTLPIPPASFALLAGVQMVLGRALLLDELWVIALCQLAMTLMAYLLARAFTNARNAVLVAAATAPVLISTPKEIAYDQTAQVLAWAAMVLVAHGLMQTQTSRRRLLLTSSAAVAAFCLAFKSSTGLGTIAAVFTAVGVVTALGLRRGGARGKDWLALLAGTAVGLVGVVAVVLAVGGSLPEFVRVVFVSGPQLKGGSARALFNLFSYTTLQSPVHFTLVTALLLGYLLARAARARQGLLIRQPSDDLAYERGAPGLAFAIGMSAVVVLVFGGATTLLAVNAVRIPDLLAGAGGFAGLPLMLGLLLLAVLTVSNGLAARCATDRRAVYAAMALACGLVSLMHNLSDPKLRPFYDNNPVIALSVLSLLLLCDNARTRILKYSMAALLVFALFGPKMQRYLNAREPVADDGFWRGLRVSENGQTIVRAAQRARQLAGPNGTVLTLPEDPMLATLIGRPRPKLLGGIVFVDQYPQHALDRDLALLKANPPTVLVLHPRDEVGWNQVYRIWSLHSPAAKLQRTFVRTERQRYHLDSSYDTWLFQGPSKLDLYVLTSPGRVSHEGDSAPHDG